MGVDFVPRDVCQCLEHYAFGTPYGNKVLYLTLPEITQNVSKGLAKSNADKKQLREEWKSKKP